MKRRQPAELVGRLQVDVQHRQALAHLLRESGVSFIAQGFPALVLFAVPQWVQDLVDTLLLGSPHQRELRHARPRAFGAPGQSIVVLSVVDLLRAAFDVLPPTAIESSWSLAGPNALVPIAVQARTAAIERAQTAQGAPLPTPKG